MSGITFNQDASFAASNNEGGPGAAGRLMALLTRNARQSAEQMTARYLYRRPAGGGVNWLGDGTGLN